ncbi:MAG: hypothetical protein K2Y25_09370 [Pseudomonadaceae bacterium]|nr:hypothetical protein [Pseudomonadaceae bacterium]
MPPAVSGDPVRAAQMEAQFNQPVTKGDGSQAVGGRLAQVAGQAYDIVKPFATPLATAGGMLAAPAIDFARNTAIRASGGDPATADGGAAKYQDRAINEVRPAISAVQGAGRAIADTSSRAVLSATGAKPSVTQPASITQPAPNQLPATAAGAASASIAAPPVDNGYSHSSVRGIVRKGNDFTNKPETVAGAGGTLAQHPGAVNSGWDSNLEIANNEKALIEGDRKVAIQRQMDTQQSGISPGLHVLGESTALGQAARTARISTGGAGAQAAGLLARSGGKDQGGALEQLPAQDPGAVASAANARLIAEESANLALHGQKQASEQQDRVNALQALMADTTATPEDRAAAGKAYATLTTPSKDRFVTYDENLGEDSSGRMQTGKRVLDTATGTPVAGQTPPQAQKTASMAEVRSTAKSRGISEDDVLNHLKAQGVTING